MNKLSFNKKKENTKSVVFKVDPITSQNLVALRNMYSKETNRRVTTGEILKKLINQHSKDVL
tara:strand:+ start:421 stop:606 length:186 start_codon:yes stop_codon:yes gene_type:complete